MATPPRPRRRAAASAPNARPSSAGVGVAAVATMCHLTPRHVQRLVQEGVIPRATRGRYNLAAAVRAYITYLQHKVEQAHAEATLRPPDPGVSNGRARKLHAEAELAELRIQRESAKFVDVEVAAAEIRHYQEKVRAVLIAARSRYADRIPAAQLHTLIHDILRDLLRGTEEYAGEDEAA